ncbi:Mitochondrial intermediate peptidase [Thoreauomyces humboldtii]|nr:Mitochondrial intermediate peptidase [Thoreauomyces humboldtii]
MAKTVKRLDRLSDILCSVVDSAELIRNVHPDTRFIRAANDAHHALSSIINQLNTHTRLYQSLYKVMGDASVTKSFCGQERKVGDLLLIDFEKSGIHMPAATRKRFVDLQDRIGELGHAMITMAGPGIQKVTFDDPNEKLQGVPANVRSMLSRGGGSATVPTVSALASTILKSATAEDVRKEMYMAMHSGSKDQVDVLEAMLWTRAELARMLGKNSYAEMSLVDKMAESPENVISFLESLADLHKPKAEAELLQLQRVKDKHVEPGNSSSVKAWDRAYYSQFLGSAHQSPRSDPLGDPFHATPLPSPASGDLAAYFSVGTTFQGLSDLFRSLYGITLEPATVAPGEVWHAHVRKLNVVHETDGKIGTIYCDLFTRNASEGRKYENAAHFTVRCSRRIDDEECFGSAYQSNNMKILDSEKEVVEGGVAKRYQLPIVVLVTAFKAPTDDRSPSLLSLWEVETLFHEMGHAMHSMLARTDFQHIAGTRVPMDFVEVPSIFMENFAKSPQVLSSFGRHHRTGAPVPQGLLASARAVAATSDALDTQHQLQLSLLDQMYHSPLALQHGFDSTVVLAESQRLYNVFPPVPEAAWQVQFTHLYSYGATYYSYFWSRRWASRIWRRWFEGRDPEAWKEGGQLFRTELLGWGGGRDPWTGLENIGVVKDGERHGVFKPEMSDLGIMP